MQNIRVALEHLTYGLRVGEHYEATIAGNVQRESVAIPAVTLVKHCERAAREAK
jgi:hypothetical protein